MINGGKEGYQVSNMISDNSNQCPYCKEIIEMPLFCFVILKCYMKYMMDISYGCF